MHGRVASPNGRARPPAPWPPLVGRAVTPGFFAFNEHSELGIRMALGARPGQVLAQFLAQGLRSGVAGLVAGLGAATYAQRWLASLLYEIEPFDAATFCVASGALLALLAFAVWWPARRASRIDPQVALRCE
jgi:ABC-type lipoprotein release transport system permease subunit